MSISSLLLKNRLANTLLRIGLHTPWLGKKLQRHVNQQMATLLTEIKSNIRQQRAQFNIVDELPEVGLPANAILDRLQYVNAQYVPARSSSTVYTAYSGELNHLLQTVWTQTNLTNPLRFEWPLINLMEAEIIAMCQRLLHGDKDAPGLIAHSGSHAIFEACKAYVLAARKRGIKKPVIIAPKTIHVAFDKAAQILNICLHKVSIDEKTGTVDIVAMRKAINRHTILLVGSAPCYPLGTIDPIDQIAQLAEENHLPVLIDACLGGFLTMFAHDAGFDNVPVWDFALPCVDSMIIGTHKYGQTPNGNSVLLFSQSSSVHPGHVHLDWPGGLYVSPSIDGTRSGADIALTWSVLCAKGRDQYVRDTQAILQLKENLWHALREIKEINVPYYPLLSIIVIAPKRKRDTLLIAQRLHELNGWMVNILQDEKHNITGFHFCLTAVHAYDANFCNQFIHDLQDAIAFAKKHPRTQLQGIAQVYPALQRGVPESIKRQMGLAYLNALNSVG